MLQIIPFGAFAMDRQPTGEAAPNGGTVRVIFASIAHLA
jgi:hypothetical protein